MHCIAVQWGVTLSESDMGRVHPRVMSSRVGLGHKILQLGRVGLGRAQFQCQKCLINVQFTRLHATNILDNDMRMFNVF